MRTYVFENIKTKTNHNPNGPNNPEFQPISIYKEIINWKLQKINIIFISKLT